MYDVITDDEDDSLQDDFQHVVFGFKSKLESLDWIKAAHTHQWVYRPAQLRKTVLTHAGLDIKYI